MRHPDPVETPATAADDAASAPAGIRPPPETPAGIVAMGASAGGLDALQAVLASVPRGFPWPILVAQHMDPHHPSQLSEILARVSTLPIHEAVEGEKILPGHVYACPPQAEMAVTPERTLRFRSRPAGRPQRIDHLFSSVAAAYEDKAIVVVLSGTGADGSLGALAAKRRGGTVVAESEGTAKHYGMPSSAIQAGAVDFVRPSGEIGPLLQRLVDGSVESETIPEKEGLQEILDLLRSRRGTTFDQYRLPTLRRRLCRRMEALGVGSLAAYAAHVKDKPQELDALFDTLLINVTEFFRDAEAWKALEEQVVPQLVAKHRAGEEVRVWCAGCASGEEAYSIAILLAEVLGDATEWANVKIFATDIDAAALAEARAGRYDAARLANLSPERLARFFRPAGSMQEVIKPIRRMVIFGLHDLTRDPPIGRLDLIACRNVFIYFDVPLQRRVLAGFHYALSGAGHLFMGRSEAMPRGVPGFVVRDRHAHLYQRSPGVDVARGSATARSVALEQDEVDDASQETDAAPESLATLGGFLLETANLVVLVLDEKREVCFSNRYARLLLGGAGARLEGMPLREALPAQGPEFQEALDRAHAAGQRTHVEAVKLSVRGRLVTLDIVIETVAGPPGRSRTFLVGQDITAAEETRIALAERAHQLHETIETLQTTNEELQSANEELVTANEEMQSSNEELATLNEEVQSTNEELETTNEELQSTNEELGALNAELQRAATEMERLDRLLQCVADTTRDAIVVADANDVVVHWGSRATDLFGQRPDEAVGRSLLALDLQVETHALRGMLTAAAQQEEPVVSALLPVRGRKGAQRWATLSVRCARDDAGNRIGSILAFHDRTQEQEGEKAVAALAARCDALLRGTREAVLLVSREGCVTHATPAAEAILGPRPVQPAGHLWDMAEDPAAALLLKGALMDLMRPRDGHAVPAHVIPVRLRDGRQLSVEFVAVGTPGDAPLVILRTEGGT